MEKRGKAEQRAARSARLSAALRENLKRRKAQARDRAEGRAQNEPMAAATGMIESDVPDFRRNRGRE
ncbi:MAG TPA: hypothetical protein VK430_08420 [Xanthobacteraceae bacterium]|nr:hypothetical protein [Xanthobacteraceae bacterium]